MAELNNYIIEKVQKGSGIRDMFMLARRLKEEGKNPIDLSLGTPDLFASEYDYGLIAVANENIRSETNLHRYGPNDGLPETKKKVANYLKNRFKLPFSEDHVFMTPGAAPAIVVSLLLNIEPVLQQSGQTIIMNQKPEEVIILAPGFVEYSNYINLAQGISVPVKTNGEFRPDINKLEKAITPQTRVIILNSPNNPTGAVYSHKDYKNLTQLLNEKNEKLKRPIVVIEDSPYDDIVFGIKAESILNYYPNTIYVNSLSKSKGWPGERIGFGAFHPEMYSSNVLPFALDGARAFIRNIVVNAPVTQQRVVARCGLEPLCDVSIYEKRVKKLADCLIKNGFKLIVNPDHMGTFYLFPEIPTKFQTEKDFREVAMKGDDPLIYTPGNAFSFGLSGYDRHIRFAACVSEETIERACNKIKKIC